MIKFLILLGFVSQKTNTITLPKVAQVGIPIGIVLFIISHFFQTPDTHQKNLISERQKELKKIYENPTPTILNFKNKYEKVVASWQDDWAMPSWEKLYELSTEQLLRLFERVEATGNRLLVDMIREVLLGRWGVNRSFKFNKLLPPTVYTVVVVCTNAGWGVSILESNELFQEVAHSNWYVGATDVYIRGDGFFEMQERTVINSKMPGVDREIIEGVVKEFLEHIGLKNADQQPKWMKGVIFPELPAFSVN